MAPNARGTMPRGFCAGCRGPVFAVERGQNPSRLVAWRWCTPAGERVEPLPLDGAAQRAPPERCPGCRQ